MVALTHRFWPGLRAQTDLTYATRTGRDLLYVPVNDDTSAEAACWAMALALVTGLRRGQILKLTSPDFVLSPVSPVTGAMLGNTSRLTSWDQLAQAADLGIEHRAALVLRARGPRCDRWCLVTGVERRGDETSSVLLLDPEAGATWAAPHNARLDPPGRSSSEPGFGVLRHVTGERWAIDQVHARVVHQTRPP